MFGHFRLGFGNLNHLAPFPANLRCRFQAGATAGADSRHMLDDVVRLSYQAAGDARMPRLSPALLAAAPTQAARVRPFGRSIAGRRLVAVMAILLQTRRQHLHLLFQLGLVGQQLRHLSRLDRQQLFDPGDQRVWTGLIYGQDFIP